MRTITLVVALSAAAACVPKKKFTALEVDLAATRSTLDAERTAGAATVTSLEQALADEIARRTALEAQIVALQDKNTLLVRDKSQLDTDVAQMQAALRELEERKAAADLRIAEYRDLLQKFRAMIDAGRLKVKIVDGRMVVELASDILFPSGSAALSPEGEQALLEVAGVLASIALRSFQIEGHTDDDPIRTERFPSNWELGAGRAITVVRTLEKGGVPIARLSAASYAANRPVMPNRNPEGKAANRRIEIVVVPDLSLLPGYEELSEIAGKP